MGDQLDQDDQQDHHGGRRLSGQGNNSNGVVLFKDLCTNEWAMNTLEQMSMAHAK